MISGKRYNTHNIASEIFILLTGVTELIRVCYVYKNLSKLYFQKYKHAFSVKKMKLRNKHKNVT